MPFMNEGNLNKFCAAKNFAEDMKRALWNRLILDGYEALDFLFERFHVAHCDINENNVYVQTNVSGNLKLVIGDFDCVREPLTVSLNPIGADRTGTVPILAYMSDDHKDGHCLLLSRSVDYYLLLCSVSSVLWRCNFLEAVFPREYMDSIEHIQGLPCDKRTRVHTFPCTYSANVLTKCLDDYDSVEAIAIKLLRFYGGSEATSRENAIFLRTMQALVEGRAIPVSRWEKNSGSAHYYYVYLQEDQANTFQKHLVYLTADHQWRLVKKDEEAARSFY